MRFVRFFIHISPNEKIDHKRNCPPGFRWPETSRNVKKLAKRRGGAAMGHRSHGRGGGTQLEDGQRGGQHQIFGQSIPTGDGNADLTGK